MGFCLVNNVAIAARHMQAEHGVGRIAIVDFDVHHGNGTQDVFADDDSVLFVVAAPGRRLSRHRRRGRGRRDDGQHSAAAPAAATWSGCAAFEQHVAPAVAAFRPSSLLVSAGFDAHEDEDIYLVDMHVTEDGLPRARAPMRCARAARRRAVLEGGYNLETLPRLVAAAAGRLRRRKLDGRLAPAV